MRLGGGGAEGGMREEEEEEGRTEKRRAGVSWCEPEKQKEQEVCEPTLVQTIAATQSRFLMDMCISPTVQSSRLWFPLYYPN